MNPIGCISKRLIITAYLYRKLSLSCLYRNKEVFVDIWQEKVTIIGIDEYGFLKVRKSSDGQVVTLHTDAHSFDVQRGIIREKAI
jgi:hypothetical protein